MTKEVSKQQSPEDIELALLKEKFRVSEIEFGRVLDAVKIEIDNIVEISNSVLDVMKDVKDDTELAFLSGYQNYVGGTKTALEYVFKNILARVRDGRDINHVDIEYFLHEIQLHLEDHGFDFSDYACLDPQGNKNNFERDFQRQIIQQMLDTSISSFNFEPHQSKKTKSDNLTPEHNAQLLEELRGNLKNVLHEPILEEFLVMLTDKGFIQLSDNLGNSIGKEIEQKILDIDKEDIVSQLDGMKGVEKTFEGRVTDEYYDFPDNRLDPSEDDIEDENLKSSFRIRTKEQKGGPIKYYYTVKRKDKDSTGLHGYRDCWEEEYEINVDDYQKVQSMVTNLGLYKSREKSKYRTSYAHKKDKVKFDIDKYRGIPHVLEIEGESRKKIEKYKKKLGVQDHETSSKGSRWLHEERYKIPYKKFKVDGTAILDASTDETSNESGQVDEYEDKLQEEHKDKKSKPKKKKVPGNKKPKKKKK